MSAYNSVDGSPATQNRALLTDMLQARLGLSRIRDLRRGGHRRRDGAASHRGEHRHRDERRVRRRTRRRLSVVVAAASAVPRRIQARSDSGLGDRRRRGARAARQVRARAVRASVRGRRQRGVLERQRRSIARSRSRRRASRSCCSKNDAGALPLAQACGSIAVIGADAVEARLGGYSGPGNQKVSILDGIRAALQARVTDGVVRYAPGPGRISREYVVVPAEAADRRRTAAARCAAHAASTSTTTGSTARRD